MKELIDIHASKLRFAFGSMIIFASLVFLALMITSPRGNEVIFALPGANKSSTTDTTDNYGSSNAVTSGMARMADATVKAVDTVEYTLSNSARSFATSTSRIGMGVARTTIRTNNLLSRHMYRGLGFVATSVGNGVVFVVHAPIKVLGFAANTISSNSIVRPANTSEVPVIDSQLDALYATYPVVELEEGTDQTHDQAHTEALWPIHGRVTTQFGVPHRPYQVTHTGLDISSGSYSGITPVKPFRSGRVLDVIQSRAGLGNHIVVDHGEGLTSVYAHLYSTSVQVGQSVDTGSVLGYEGSSGVSTGTHLHFEIRLNGQPTDPQQYIAGQP